MGWCLPSSWRGAQLVSLHNPQAPVAVPEKCLLTCGLEMTRRGPDLCSAFVSLGSDVGSQRWWVHGVSNAGDWGRQEVGWQHPDTFLSLPWHPAAGRGCWFVNELEQLLAEAAGSNRKNAQREPGRDGHPRGH